MSLFDPKNPIFNASLLYILLIVIIFMIKPNFLYSQKKHKFKEFGLNENQTLLSFPIVSVSCAVLLYMVFSTIETICLKLKKFKK